MKIVVRLACMRVEGRSHNLCGFDFKSVCRLIPVSSTLVSSLKSPLGEEFVAASTNTSHKSRCTNVSLAPISTDCCDIHKIMIILMNMKEWVFIFAPDVGTLLGRVRVRAPHCRRRVAPAQSNSPLSTLVCTCPQNTCVVAVGQWGCLVQDPRTTETSPSRHWRSSLAGSTPPGSDIRLNPGGGHMHL